MDIKRLNKRGNCERMWEEQQMIFFTIPWIFVIAVVVMAAAIGASVLEFIVRHIVIISGILWFPAIWFIWKTWKNETESDIEKMDAVLYPLLQVPTYAALVQMLIAIVSGQVAGGLFGMGLFLIFTVPVGLAVLLLLNGGAAWVLSWLYKKVIKSKGIMVLIAAAVVLVETWYLWNNI